MKKKIVSIILILTIVLSSAELSKKEAEAAWFIPFIPAIAEGLVSLSEILLLATATYATGCAVSESFDQSDIDYIAGKLDTATSAAGDWWRDIKSSAVRVDEPTVSLQDDIAMGKVINFSDYYQPDGGKPSNNNEPRKSKKIDVTAVVGQQLADTLANLKGRDKINEGSSVADTIKNVLNNSFLNSDIRSNYNKSLILYDYDVVFWNKGTNQINVISSKLPLNFTIQNNTTGQYDFFYGTGDTGNTYNSFQSDFTAQGFRNIQNGYYSVTRSNKSNFNNIYLDNYSLGDSGGIGTYDFGSPVTQFDATNITKILEYVDSCVLYSNYDVRIHNIFGTDPMYPTDTYIPKVNTQIPTSVYSNVDVSKGFTITPTKELRDTITNAQPVKTTDDITKLISDADKNARANGKQVIDIDIDGNTSVTPDIDTNTTTIVDTLKNFIGNPLQAILDFLKDILNKILSAIKEIPDLFRGFIEWIKGAWNDISDLPGQIGQSIKAVAIELFIPTSISLDNFKNQAEQIVESKTGILSYPLVLLVKLSEFVFTMDSRDCILTFPKLQYKGYVLCEEHTLNLTELVEGGEFKDIYNIYIIVTDFIMIMLVVYFGSRKIDSIMKGE